MASPIYQQVTDSIIAELEKGVAPWIRPWRADLTADRNLVSGKPYRGVNRLILGMTGMARGFSAPVWGTYQQWANAGAQVRKGEKATHIVFFKPVETRKAQPDGTEEDSCYLVVKGYCVFNADQCDGVTFAPVNAPEADFVPVERAEETLAKSGAVIRHGGDSAFYMPSQDAIQMPNRSAFLGAEHYYATAFHELTHWTGHKSRCDRNLTGRYGNPAYAFEELVAEMGAAFLCADHRIQGELRHAAYLQSWLKACREDNRAIFRASALAQKAADFILALDTRQAVAA